LFDAQELIVFRQPIRTAQRAGLNLAAVRRHGNVGDGRIFGLAGAMRENGGDLFVCASSMASSVPVSESIWFIFTRIEFAVPVSMPFWRNFTLVTNKSSPVSSAAVDYRQKQQN